MKASRIRHGLVLVIAASAMGLGCELIVDFDRTKIPVEGTDATATDATTTDSAIDAPVDTGSDVPNDGGPDGTADASDAADAADADGG